MSKCSEDKKFAENLEEDSVSSSLQLYQSLTTKLEILSNSIKVFLEFVSKGILYILGFNPMMYIGSGDGHMSSNNASLRRRSRRNRSTDINHRHDSNEYVGSSGICSSGGDSGTQPDSSDSDSRCCFGVTRLKRFILRRRRQTQNACRRYENRHTRQRKNESPTPLKQVQESPLPVGDGERKSISSDSSETDHSETQITLPKIELTVAESMPLEEKHSPDNIETLQVLCRKEMPDDNIEKNLEKKNTKQRSPKSLFTQPKYPERSWHGKPVPESFKLTGVNRRRNKSNSFIHRPVPFSALIAEPAVADDTRDGSSENVNKETKVDSELSSSESLLFNKIVEEVSSTPLEKTEEDVIQCGLKHIDIVNTPKKLEHVTRMYCTATQALRRLNALDEIFDEAIHCCRRGVYNYMRFGTGEHYENKCDAKILYFKAVVHFYNQFKQCALNRNHDIGQFIKKSKDKAEREIHIDTDKEITTTARPLHTDIENQTRKCLGNKFQENSESTDFSKKNEVTESNSWEDLSDSEVESIPDISPDNHNKIKQGISEYLTGVLGSEGVDTNKSFQESIDCLSDHFSKLGVNDSRLDPGETRSEPADSSSNPEEAKGKTCFKVKVFQFQPATSSNPFSCVSRKSETRFDQVNPWKGSNVMTKPLGNFTKIPFSPLKSSAEKNRDSVNAESEPVKTHAVTDNLESNTIREDTTEEQQTGISGPDTCKVADSEEQTHYPVGCENLYKTLVKREYHKILIETFLGTENNGSDSEDNQLEDAKTSDENPYDESPMDVTHGNKSSSDWCETEQRDSNQHEAPRQSGEKKRQPPPVPKKPTTRRPGGAYGRQRKRQPPPVPRKPDSSTRRTAVSPNDQLDGTDQESCANQSNNENNSFMPQDNLSLSSDDDGGLARMVAKRIFQQCRSCSDVERQRKITCQGDPLEIVIGPKGAYEVFRNESGTETRVENIPDFTFGHADDASVQSGSHTQGGARVRASATKHRKRPSHTSHVVDEPVSDFVAHVLDIGCGSAQAETPKKKFANESRTNESTDEKYKEHFDIDRSVYDESGCKIMPGSGKKVNPRALQQKDKRKQKTKGVANKHLMKAFDDAAHNQDLYDGDDENEMQHLVDLDELDTDEFGLGNNAENDPKDQLKETTTTENELENTGVIINHIEDVRHWEMLPTEVRRKQDDENSIDDKYSMPSTGRTPDDKKKGKKKKGRKQKPQPMSLQELKYQFQ